MTYSIAIRTLGKATDELRQELFSIQKQTVPPENVIIYLAEGFEAPGFRIGNERYVTVRKGMVAQRALHYEKIDSDCILMLDDDVSLAPDSAEKMLRALEENGADCVGADVFKNHEMSLKTKVLSAVTNLVFPHKSREWAFKMHRNGSFSYNNSPTSGYYKSQTCGGPAVLWRKDSFLNIHYEDELWLDELGFAYGDDCLLSYKLFTNGGKLGVLYDSGITNLDGRSASNSYRTSPQRIYTRTKASFMIWWRSLYSPARNSRGDRALTIFCYGMKALYLALVFGLASLLFFDHKIVGNYLKGMSDGWEEVHSKKFSCLADYVLAFDSLLHHSAK